MIRCAKRFAEKFRACFETSGPSLADLIQRKEELVEQYADAFIELARSEEIPEPKRKTIMYKLRQMRPSEIERVYNACCRFGIGNLTRN